MWVLDVGIRLNDEHFGTMEMWHMVNETLERTVPVECVSAGTGFGCRDMQWEFSSERIANYYARRIHKVFGGVVEYASVYEEV